MTEFNRRDLLAATIGTGVVTALPARAAGDVIYRNPLATPADIKGFQLEGEALIDFELGRMRLRNKLSAEQGQASNFVFWCPDVFPDNVEISWNFWPIEEPGLCILFFAARGLLPGGGDAHVLDKRLKARAGIYDQYTQSDVSALQIAYFRRRWPEERAFHLSNLRRAPGFELLAQGPDPLPDVKDATPPYRIRVRKSPRGVRFLINDLPVVSWNAEDDKTVPGQGSIGFRQMAPLIAAYSDLEVRKLADQ
ncbi:MULTISPECIES: DUF1961 family protein [Asticcacaulis]|uniref:DUF1961 family protein n=1 Tax=Asticcacaulis TaxID=76890 RepID=UPI001AE61B9D|nr:MULTISPECIES: DUF1961 family protein [Asticcacaulis]MBP2160809.1 hypothetical protein [Asticcacaulis solisilvae]MDR6801987.1 hypothetical protein [Asticcacaulis sp. BE141]